MSSRYLLELALVLVSAGCGPGAHTRAGGGVGPLSVHEVAWNPTQAAVGQVRAVAEASGVTSVFADTGVTILSAGAVVAVDRSGTDWVDAAVIPGADGSPRWIVGLSRDGRLYRLKNNSAFEDVSARYGLEDERVRAITPLGDGRVGFLLTQQIAIADGNQVQFFRAPQFTNLLGGAGYYAGLEGTGLFLSDDRGAQARRYVLPGLTHAALGADAQFYASTPRAIYFAAPRAELSLAFDSQSSNVHDLVTAQDTVWFADGRELGVVQTDHVLETNSHPIAADAKLAPTASGDVWAISSGVLRRFSRGSSSPDRAALWVSNIAPIFARVCAACHEPGGVSGVDLSSADAWEAERAEIRERVVNTRTMPPQGHDLPAADRAVIAGWSSNTP
jgi:mono/diheme cytochrome c family protein